MVQCPCARGDSMGGVEPSGRGPLPSAFHRRNISTRTLGPAVALLLLLVVSGSAPAVRAGVPASAPAVPPSPPAPAPAAIAPVAMSPVGSTLTVNNSGAVNLSNQFWGVTVNNEVHVLRGETESVNATPARVLVWPGAMAGEDYDPFTQTHYETNYGTPTHALTNESQFVQMCEAIHCIAVMQVPAEIDNPSFAEAVVNYTEVNLSFHPAYWMIGNEPELWSHWQVPWKNWGSDFTYGPTPTQFGDEVVKYVDAIRQVDNTTPILGLPASGCTCGYWTFAQWIAGVLKVTGNKIQAVAFHEYPAGWLGTGDGSLHDFYATINSDANIPVRMVAARDAVTSACKGCNVSVFISELGAALSWSAYGQYAAGFSGALSIASQITQAMADNLTNVDLFATELNTTNSWFTPTGEPRPDYTLYTEMFDHLGTEAFPVNLTGLDYTLYGVDTIAPNDQGRRDLMVMNDNITHSVSFAPRFAENPGTAPVEAWYWNGSIHNTADNGTTWVEPYTANPVPVLYPEGLPDTFVLPPQSMVVFEEYPSGSTYVNVNETGVPANTPWFFGLGSNYYRTTAQNLSLLVPSGTYPLAPTPINLPIGGREFRPVERLAGSGPSDLEVGGAYTNATLGFVPQWKVEASASPAGEGNVSSSVGWWNQNETLNISATPALGYAFVRWDGWGPGSYSGPDRRASLVPGGRVLETAIFVPGNVVDLVETGLAGGTPWSVTVHGFMTNSTSHVLTLYEPNGSYGYQVSPVPGYRVLPKDGGFTVDTATSVVQVRFIPLRPAPLLFPVGFHVSGLPASMTVPITVRGISESAGTVDPQFELLNGSYAYQVGYVPGYHADVPLKTFFVGGGPLTVEVPFVPTVYHAIWEASGSRSGMNWSVVVNGSELPAASAWVTQSLPNGTYPYAVLVPPEFSVSPRTGVIDISGAEQAVRLNFTLVEFRAGFAVTGLPGPTPWGIRFGNLTQHSAVDQTWFQAPNGTYTFDVLAPAGYFAVPSHGSVTVSGDAPPTAISFHLSSEQPSAALVAALTAGALWVSVWIGGSIAAGFVIVRWFRGQGD